MPTKKIKTKSFFSSLMEIIKQSWVDLLLIIFFNLCLLLLVTVLLSFAYYLLTYYDIVTIFNFFTFKLIWEICLYLLFLIIAVIAQILIINALLNPKIKLRDNLKTIKKYFWSFLGLIILSNILFLIFTLPIYVAIFLFIFKSYVLGIISIFLGLILAILLASHLIFSPFILITEKSNCVESIKKSIALAQKQLANIIFKIIILGLIIVILNSISLLITEITIAGLFLGLLITIIMLIFIFSYLFAMYKEFK